MSVYITNMFDKFVIVFQSLVAGPKCISCESEAFHFSDTGCMECWCNGLKGVECNSSMGSYDTVR